mmetsp:Transcript_33528/g.107102  ORF Transcript_33528/g.107102 Transcript_33528/m.107102 type:complete len:394 (+) Transcript_33528:1699-2880(+)
MLLSFRRGEDADEVHGDRLGGGVGEAIFQGEGSAAGDDDEATGVVDDHRRRHSAVRFGLEGREDHTAMGRLLPDAVLQGPAVEALAAARLCGDRDAAAARLCGERDAAAAAAAAKLAECDDHEHRRRPEGRHHRQELPAVDAHGDVHEARCLVEPRGVGGASKNGVVVDGAREPSLVEVTSAHSPNAAPRGGAGVRRRGHRRRREPRDGHSDVGVDFGALPRSQQREAGDDVRGDDVEAPEVLGEQGGDVLQGGGGLALSIILSSSSSTKGPAAEDAARRTGRATAEAFAARLPGVGVRRGDQPDFQLVPRAYGARRVDPARPRRIEEEHRGDRAETQEDHLQRRKSPQGHAFEGVAAEDPRAEGGVLRRPRDVHREATRESFGDRRRRRRLD